ncbi:MAG TPA: redoxin domain-containing protein [Planococcus sp. (in: firmicutes)]|nr:redoxin domain-containing protein [Planococcus sp. (in: firmicutes)]
MNKNILSIAIIVLLLAIAAVNFLGPSFAEEEPAQPASGGVATAPESSAPAEGQAAPDFELTSLDGEAVRLSDYRGKKVILNFWATWCPPCKAEMPHMQKFYEANKDKGIEVLAVNLTSIDKGEESVHAFVEEFGLTFPIPMDRDGTLGPQYQAVTIPTTYIIDTEGIIQKKIVGPMDEAMMQKLTSSID